MTSPSAAPVVGGTGSVLVIWSLIVVVVGCALFVYSIAVTVRGRRSRKRRKRAGPAGPRPFPPPPASRPFTPGQLPGQLQGGQPQAGQLQAGQLSGGPLPSGPTAGGQPFNRTLAAPRSRALPPGPRPLALPSGQQGAGHAPPAPRPGMFAPPAALPAGPTAGPVPTQPTSYAAGGTTYGVPAGSATTYGTSTPGTSTPSTSTPSAPSYGQPAFSGGSGGAASTTYGSATVNHAGEAISSIYGAPPGGRSGDGQTDHSGAERDRGRGKRSDECATLRAECEQLRQIATDAADAAARAAAEATEAHADYVAAQRASDEARQAFDVALSEAGGIATQLATLEKSTDATHQQLQQETSHAAFAAYRRGDISAEQLREVFKRAEGWTPEHDQMSRRVTELRAHENELARASDVAKAAEGAAGERAHAAAAQARLLEDRARTAAADARGRCAAADACEQRRRR